MSTMIHSANLVKPCVQGYTQEFAESLEVDAVVKEGRASVRPRVVGNAFIGLSPSEWKQVYDRTQTTKKNFLIGATRAGMRTLSPDLAKAMQAEMMADAKLELMIVVGRRPYAPVPVPIPPVKPTIKPDRTQAKPLEFRSVLNLKITCESGIVKRMQTYSGAYPTFELAEEDCEVLGHEGIAEGWKIQVRERGCRWRDCYSESDAKWNDLDDDAIIIPAPRDTRPAPTRYQELCQRLDILMRTRSAWEEYQGHGDFADVETEISEVKATLDLLDAEMSFEREVSRRPVIA